MHSLPYIVGGLKVRSMYKLPHEDSLTKICKKKGYTYSLEYSINNNILPCDNAIGLKNKAP